MLPSIVQLHFLPVAPTREVKQREDLAIEARTPLGDIVMAGRIRDVAAWLKLNGYRWAFGSNAMWVRS